MSSPIYTALSIAKQIIKPEAKATKQKHRQHAKANGAKCAKRS